MDLQGMGMKCRSRQLIVVVVIICKIIVRQYASDFDPVYLALSLVCASRSPSLFPLDYA